MKKLTTLALAALLTTVSATSVFAAASTTTNTEVGYTAGGVTPPDGSGTYVVKIPKTVTIVGEGFDKGATLDVAMDAIDGAVANLPANLSVQIEVASNNGYKLKTSKLTNTPENNTTAKWVYYYQGSEISTEPTTMIPGTGEADTDLAGVEKVLGSLTAAAPTIYGKAVMPTKPTVITDKSVKFTDTLTYTITETDSGVAKQ